MINVTFETTTRIPQKREYKIVCREVFRAKVKTDKIFEEELSGFIQNHQVGLSLLQPSRLLRNPPRLRLLP